MANHFYSSVEFFPPKDGEFDNEVVEFIKKNNLPFVAYGIEDVIDGIRGYTEYRSINVMQGMKWTERDVTMLGSILPKDTIIRINDRDEGDGSEEYTLKVSDSGRIDQLCEITTGYGHGWETLYVPDNYREEHAWELTEEQKEEQDKEQTINAMFRHFDNENQVKKAFRKEAIRRQKAEQNPDNIPF